MLIENETEPKSVEMIVGNTGHPVITPAQAVKAFLSRCNKPNTRKSYKSALASFFAKGCPDDLIIFQSQATTENVQKWLDQLQGKWGQPRKSQATIFHRFSIMSQFFDACVIWGLLPNNPANKYLIQRPAAPQWEPSIGLMTKDMKAMLDACLSDHNQGVALRDYAIILLGFSCCLRVGEIHNCNTNDIVRVGRRVSLRLPKTKRGLSQKVDLAAEVKLAIEKYILEIGGLNVLKPEQIDSGTVCRPTFVSLSPTSYGHRLSASYMCKMIKRRGAEAGININVHSHLLRHSGISHLFEMGWPVGDIQRHARHKDINTTFAYRDIWEESVKPSAADALGGLLSAGNSLL